MKKLTIKLVLGCSLAATGGLAPAASAAPSNDCEVTRILPDGREIRSRGTSSSTSTHRGSQSAHASGAAASSSSSSSHSSVSVSSSSSGRGGSQARAVTSYTDEKGHQVTTVRDERGCTITIDERGS